MNKNITKSMLFVGLTFLLCWAMVALFFAFGGKWNTSIYFGITTLYMLIPMIVVIIIQKCIYKEAIKKPYQTSFKLNR